LICYIVAEHTISCHIILNNITPYHMVLYYSYYIVIYVIISYGSILQYNAL